MNRIRLALIFYIISAPVIAGTAVTAVLTMRDVSTQMLAIAGIGGFLVAIPVAWLLAVGIGGQKG